VEVAQGDYVEAGDVVIILEAMKMETEIRAPKAGRVEALLVKAGDAIATGDALLSIA
jgi:oxaloacetate decarboxylase alpha subunit